MQIFFSNHFKKQIKKLQNKLPHIKEDLLQKTNTFNPNNEIHVGKSIYKIRIKSSDLNKGKSGGLRSYIYLYRKRNLLAPIYIYFKSEQESLNQKELEFHFNKTTEEIFATLTN